MSRRTGFPLQVRATIIERAQGRCERCGEAKTGMQVHHRRPRGMGGSRRADTNTAANGLYLCADCHAWVESYRQKARENGLLLTQSELPDQRFVELRHGVCRLDNDGTLHILKPKRGAA